LPEISAQNFGTQAVDPVATTEVICIGFKSNENTGLRCCAHFVAVRISVIIPDIIV
jgi:hypothetical protein